MPRANRRRRDERPMTMRGVHGTTTRVSWAGRTWLVRTLSGQSSGRVYTCPGCHHPVTPGTAHVVVWPADGLIDAGVDDRRHWHTTCWAARDQRR